MIEVVSLANSTNQAPPIPMALSRRLKIGVLVHELSRLRRKAIDQLMLPIGITGSQWWLLTYISLRPGLPQARLADELNLGKVALGGLIDRLNRLHLIERRPDESDKRVNLIYLSDAGVKLVREIRHISSGVQEASLQGISEDELDTAISVIARMKENLEKTTGISQESRAGSLI